MCVCVGVCVANKVIIGMVLVETKPQNDEKKKKKQQRKNDKQKQQ